MIKRLVVYFFKSKWPQALLILALILYPFFFLWQGGDLTDTGYHATRCENFFQDLRLGHLYAPVFLSYLIGGYWMEIFPKGGILGFSFLFVAFFQGSVLLVYLLLRRMGSHRVLLIGLLCGQAFAMRYNPLCYDYDCTSVFFLLLTVYFLWRAMSHNSIILLMISGASCGLAILARAPNVVLVGMVLVVLLYHSWETGQANAFIRAVCRGSLHWVLFLIGIVLTMASFGVVLKFNGLFEPFVNSLSSAVDTDDGSSYAGSAIIHQYFSGIKKFYPFVFCVSAAGIAISYLYGNRSKKSNLVLAGFICFTTAFVLFYGNFSYGNRIQFFVPAVFAILSFIVILPWRKEGGSMKSLVLLAGMTTLTCVVGSNTGLFLKMGGGLLLLIPLLGVLFWKINESNVLGVRIYWRPLLVVVAVIIFFMSTMIRIGGIYHVGNGLGVRLSALTPVDHPLMRGVFTTESGARHIEELSAAIDENIRDDNSLFIFGHEPLFYYLSAQRPAIRGIWLANKNMTPSGLSKRLESVMISSEQFPMIVITDWDILGEAGAVQFASFLDGHSYICVLRQDDFEIWNILMSKEQNSLPEDVL